MDFTTQDLKGMSREEVQALNQELAFRAFKRFLLLLGIKWIMIFGLTHAAKKYVEYLETHN